MSKTNIAPSGRVKSQTGSGVYTDENVVYVNSDRYFNDSSKRIDMLESMGMDVQPVDVFGGFVPQDKSLGNLKKAQKAIRERFGLNTE